VGLSLFKNKKVLKIIFHEKRGKKIRRKGRTERQGLTNYDYSPNLYSSLFL
jgi:hypothetical protein